MNDSPDHRSAVVPQDRGDSSVSDDSTSPPGRASLGEAVRAVAWSFFGVRRRDAHERDAVRLHPVVVIATGIALAALFVAVLLLIVHAVTG